MVKSSKKKSLFFLLFCMIWLVPFLLSAQDQQLYQIKIYHLDHLEQEKKMDRFLGEAYLPALHRAGIKPIGVFKPLGQDTTSDRRVYVLIPFSSFNRFKFLPDVLQDDSRYQKAGAEYIQATHDSPPYSYIETILLEAFPLAPEIVKPNLNSDRSQRVYELRSYAGATEKLNRNKIEMFNEGGEIEIFSRLGFNAIFYGTVLSGSNMPDLMYMTSFENMESRDNHWGAFRNDPKWKEISTMDKYQNNVSRAVIQLLRPTDYSDL